MKPLFLRFQHSVPVLLSLLVAGCGGGNYPGAASKTKYLTPAKYASAGTSGLTATIKDGENNVTFDLKP